MPKSAHSSSKYHVTKISRHQSASNRVSSTVYRINKI